MDIPKPKPPVRNHIPSEATVTLSKEIRGLTAELHESNKFDAKFLENYIASPVQVDTVSVEQIVTTDAQKSLKKVPFVPKPHLTQNPFRESEELLKLQKSMEAAKPPVKRKPIRKTSTKQQEKNR